jgi:putative heme-binding domain-containing protein
MMHRSALLAFVAIAILAHAHAAAQRQPPIEPWADPGMPVRAGLRLWLDASRQPLAAKAHDQRLTDADAPATWYDGSGYRQDLTQPHAAARPTFFPTGVRFDGVNDHLLRDDERAPSLTELTAVIVVAPRSNKGHYRGFLSSSALGKSDYRTGFNLDMGPSGSSAIEGFDDFNVEGSGFGVAFNLFEQAAVPFGQPHAITVTVGPPGRDAVKVYLHGERTGQRPRGPADPIATQRLVLGARSYTNSPTPPAIQDFLHGDVLEVMLFDRVLDDAERKKLDEYLTFKHPALAASALAMAEASQGGTAPIQRVKDPPAVQMFVPGFTVRELPVELTNVNNLRYRDDGVLVAMAYDGKVHLLRDTDGDGVEDRSSVFWDNAGDAAGRIVSPIGIALTPPNYAHGRGLFIACKGKLSLIVDTDGDDKADKETVVATGWPGAFHTVDALGVAIDPKDQSIYFGIGTPNFAEPYLKDESGSARYRLDDERGTILRVAPDLKSRQVVCTGIRFPVGLAFNRVGDLFATDQEGATWAPNGNPLDELLHIQPGRHYGFPARHPNHLPNVIDEPSTFDYGPQHQSTCGLTFNEPVNGGPTFGPAAWRGDAIVCGESRGKLYRTSLVKTPSGYVARNQLIASMPMLLIDATVSPRGDLLLCAHSGAPDWGSGPTGKGKLYRIRYDADHAPPQPTLVWPAGAGEARVGFDKPLDTASLAGITAGTSIVAGRYAAAGDRFEAIRPGYAIVKRQMRARRDRVDVGSVQVTPDGRTLVLGTSVQRRAIGYGLTLPGPKPPGLGAGVIMQHPEIDLAYDLTGVSADWKSSDGNATWSGWLPHVDLAVSRAFTAGSAEHDGLWKLIDTPGTLTLRTSLDLQNMLQPEVQPGSRIDFEPAPERVTVAFESQAKLAVKSNGRERADAMVAVMPTQNEFVPIEIVMPTGQGGATLTASFTTQEDARPRPLALRRFFVPWARPLTESKDESTKPEPVPQLAGGDWRRGRAVFFGNEAGCAKCHQVRGEGSDLGPDLSNLVHRDYDSVLRDIREPSGALNPDFVASTVAMKDGRVFHGIVRGAGAASDRFIVRGDYEGERAPLKLADVKKVTPSSLSIMPIGIAEGIGEAKLRDLMTFLLTAPPRSDDSTTRPSSTDGRGR